jgi:hypothetical protein
MAYSLQLERKEGERHFAEKGLPFCNQRYLFRKHFACRSCLFALDHFQNKCLFLVLGHHYNQNVMHHTGAVLC